VGLSSWLVPLGVVVQSRILCWKATGPSFLLLEWITATKGRHRRTGSRDLLVTSYPKLFDCALLDSQAHGLSGGPQQTDHEDAVLDVKNERIAPLDAKGRRWPHRPVSLNEKHGGTRHHSAHQPASTS